EIILFIGPEGGFTEDEFILFDNFANCFKLNLGPRILRADTAVISSLTLIQECLGDFNLIPKFNY
ncbi:MAG: RsmE family RNA methyltransferase, partial [Alphaproteobacteria bacterium]